MRTQRRVARLVAGLWASIGFSLVAPAHAGPSPHMVVGSWPGFFQSVDDPNIRGPASLQVTSQDQRRFTAQFSAGDLSCTLGGTLSAARVMSATGDCAGMGHLVLQGQVNEVGAGDIDPCVFEGRWVLNGPGGSSQGSLGLLHVMGDGQAVAYATGHWSGTALHDGASDPPEPVRVTADFTTDARADRLGKVGIGTLAVGGSSFEVVFDIGLRPDSASHGFALIGGGEAGILVFNGTFQAPDTPDMPATIRATHTLHLASGDALEGNVLLEQEPDGGDVPPPTGE